MTTTTTFEDEQERERERDYIPDGDLCVDAFHFLNGTPIVDDAHGVAVVVYGGAPEQLEQVLPLWKRLFIISKKKFNIM
jgi:hypothetical protein